MNLRYSATTMATTVSSRIKLAHAEYVVAQDAAINKHEWSAGECFATLAGPLKPVFLAARVLAKLTTQRDSRPCRSFSANAECQPSDIRTADCGPSRGRSLLKAATVIACLLAVSASAVADSKHTLVTEKLAGQLEPLRKLAIGERETQVCANSAAILSAANAVPDKQAPARVPLDKATWNIVVGDVANAAYSINELCETKSHSHKSIDGTMTTVAHQIAVLYESFDTLVDAARPRMLPTSLAKIRKSVDGLRWRSAQFCTQAKSIVIALAKLERPATSVKAAWDMQLANVQKVAQSTQQSACATVKPVAEEAGGLQPELASAFYKLVLLVAVSN